MAIRTLTNAKFHKFIDIFADEVAAGKYKKMPYEVYRNMRKITSPEVVLKLRKFTGHDGAIVAEALVHAGDKCYSFDINDHSFGSFIYNDLPKENPMHEDKKPTYDIFGQVIDDNMSYQIMADKVYKEALNDYYTNQTLASTSTTNSKVDSNSVTIAGYPLNGTGIGTISDCSAVTIKTATDVLREDVDALGDRLHEASAKSMKKAEDAAAIAEDALNRVSKLAMDVDALEVLASRKTDIDDTYAIEHETICKIDELAWSVDRHDYALEKMQADIEELRKIVEKSSVTFQSTSSEVYSVKNYKINFNENRKGKENMDTSKMFNFDFGPVSSAIHMSPYGMAMKNADGKYVSYDKNSGNIMDVEIFNFDAQKFLYKMPVAVNAIAVGDIVVHMRKAMFVSAVNGNRISVVDIYNGEVKDIMPTTSPFGFNFITKVVSLIDMSGANADTPFGNLLPLLMLGEGQDFKDILPMMFLTGNTGAFGNMVQNPLMLYALMGDNGNAKDILPFLLMGNFNTAPEHHCNCGCHNNENHQ